MLVMLLVTSTSIIGSVSGSPQNIETHAAQPLAVVPSDIITSTYLLLQNRFNGPLLHSACIQNVLFSDSLCIASESVRRISCRCRVLVRYVIRPVREHKYDSWRLVFLQMLLYHFV